MRRCIMLMTISVLAGCVGAGRPAPPPDVDLVDIHSEEYRKERAEAERAALLEASSGPNVSRIFYVGWEMHHGYYLIPMDAPDDWVTPDLLDDKVVALFDDVVQPMRAYSSEEAATVVGTRVVCECGGVEWTYYSQPRFIVRRAKLERVKARMD